MGKANSGKNTAANLILSELSWDYIVSEGTTMAFADPIKEIVRIMFPHVKKKHLYGSSAFRNTLIAGAVDKQGNPLTIRQALIEIGTGLGRAMNDSIWLDVFDHRFAKLAKNNDTVIVTDVRFPNEFYHLKKNGFISVRINRDTVSKLNHISETNQDAIKDNEFEYILENNGSLEDLTRKIKEELIPLVVNKQSI